MQRRLAGKVLADSLVEIAAVVVGHRRAFLAIAKVACCAASDKRFPEISWQSAPVPCGRLSDAHASAGRKDWIQSFLVNLR
jgi:hypothetical protein